MSMEKPEIVSKSDDVESEQLWDDEFQNLLKTSPKDRSLAGFDLYLYQGFWFEARVLKAVISFQEHLRTFDSDVVLATVPKCGTTWLKALTFSILCRNQFPRDGNHPLLTIGPHQLVRFLEYDLYLNNPCPDLEKECVYRPRIFSTHVPYSFLPISIKDSGCKILFACRNPMDMFISLWFFQNNIRVEDAEPLSLDQAFDKFCHGIYEFGPFFDQVLGYWKASQENPDKILFLQYEDLKEDISSHIRSLAMFLGVPFTEDEEQQGVVEEIAKICSFESLKEVDMTKNGMHASGIPNSVFFRKGKVGDWSNYLSPSMVERLEKLIEEKLGDSGLTLKLSCRTSSKDIGSV